jgi:hypothetical protein
VPRFFSPSRYPNGRPGVGLLVLRAVAALAAVGLVVARPSQSVAPLDMLGGALLIASSVAVLVGLLTASSATLLAATIMWFWLPVHGEALLSHSPAALLTFADAVALSLLGPGAFSIDARLFGPREIVVSRDGRSPRP